MFYRQDKQARPNIKDSKMYVMISGKERTEEEYGSLFADLGFRLQRTISTSSEMNIIEAVPMCWLYFALV